MLLINLYIFIVLCNIQDRIIAGVDSDGCVFRAVKLIVEQNLETHYAFTEAFHILH